MKVLVISDIHGSSYYANKIPQIVERENPDEIILLGDLYYHGPRNPFTEKYNPSEVANILNGLKNKIKAVKGNCDAEVDQMISEFPLEDFIFKKINNLRIFFTHGHEYNQEHLPKETIDALIYGHFHTGFIKKENGIIFANPGSISLPKSGTKNSYLLLEEGKILLKQVNGDIIQTQGYD